MPSLYQIKPRFQALLRPLVRRLAQSGITANQVTVTALIGSALVSAVLLLCAPTNPLAFILLPVWMLLRMALNAVDGMLAREFGQKSALGGYLNELCDVVADTLLYLPFALLPGVSTSAVLLVCALAVLAEYAGVMGPLVGAARQYQGPLGKSDRALLFSALALWAALGGTPLLINGLLWLACPVALWTLINRVRAGIAETQATASPN